MKRLARNRLNLLLLVAIIMFSVPGCAVVRYFQYRYEDATEMVDVGLSITTTPQVGLYWNSLDILTFGSCDLDGYFLGIGGGQIGLTRLYASCWAVIYGEETVGWGWGLGDPGTKPPDDMLDKRRSNIVGTLSALTGEDDFTGNGYWTNPHYTPACVHFFPHIAYVGLVWNARYMEMADFALGWVGLDISGDDGYAAGKWSFPWRSSEEEEEPVTWRTPHGTSPGAARAEPPPAFAAPKIEPTSSTTAKATVVAEPLPVAPRPASAAPKIEPTSGTTAKAAVVAEPLPVEPPAAVKPAPEYRKYVVTESGIGLMQIARKELGDASKWQSIAALNNIGPPYTVKIGQELLLPN